MSRGRLVPSTLFLKLAGIGAAVLLLVPVLPEAGYAVLGYNALLLILLLCDLATLPSHGDIRVERRLPRKLSLGEENPGQVSFNNFTSRTIRGLMRQSLPSGLGLVRATEDVRVGPFAGEQVPFKIFARQRGFYDLGPVYLRLGGVLGLAQCDYSFDAPRYVKVYPSLLGVGRYDLMARRSHLAQIGFRQVRKVGTGTEFEKLRMYLPDDDYRHINWKATAKKRWPITQEYQIERSQNIYICLDTSRYMAYRAGELTKLDYAINATLMLAHVAKKFDDNVGLLVFSDRVRLLHPPRKGEGTFAALVEALYQLEAQRCAVGYGEALHTLVARQKRRSLVVIFTDFFDRRDCEELLKFMPLLRRRHIVACITVRDQRISELAEKEPRRVEDAFDRYVAGEVLRERSRIHGILRNRGAVVADAGPEELTVVAVNQYLRVKARHLL
jgi:uncharacterized protein (DUF58 family)